MRISDWSSDVCSSDLPHRSIRQLLHGRVAQMVVGIAQCPIEHVAAEELRDLHARCRRNRREPLGQGKHRRAAPESRGADQGGQGFLRSEEHTSELQSLMRRSYAVFCLKKTKTKIT